MGIQATKVCALFGYVRFDRGSKVECEDELSEIIEVCLNDYCRPPTFKTSTSTSRTQLKLQLMREQIREEEQRESHQLLQAQKTDADRQVEPAPNSNVAPLGVVDVPTQVLQVRMKI